jgi:AraC family transcriptional regulator
MDVKLVMTDVVCVAVVEHRGDPARIEDSVLRMIEWRKASGLSPVSSSQTYGIAYDNPESTAPADFRFDICASVSAPVPANPQGVTSKTLPGGRCAVLRHVGSHARIGESVRYLLQQWLPGSGERLRDFPVYFHYLNLNVDTAECELLTDVYLPLAGG